MDARDHKRSGGVGIVRLTTWVTLASIAITVAALASLTPVGSQRIAIAIATLAGGESPPVQMAARRADLENDRRSLNEAIRLLASDRDRLLTRVSSIERNLDDITGSIKSQTARPVPENNSLQNPPNLDSLPATSGETPATKPSNLPDWLADVPKPWPHPPSAAPSASGTFPAIARPMRVTAIPAVVQSVAPTAVSRTDFGVDIGSGSDLGEVRILWNAAKAQHGKLIGNLRPIVVRREDRAGRADYRLVVGPLGNAAAAAKLCATLGAADVMCSTRPYQGERLTP